MPDLFGSPELPDGFRLILLMSWRDKGDAEKFEATPALPEDGRLRRARIVRDYGRYDRREAPQYYPEVDPAADIR